MKHCPLPLLSEVCFLHEGPLLRIINHFIFYKCLRNDEYVHKIYLVHFLKIKMKTTLLITLNILYLYESRERSIEI